MDVYFTLVWKPNPPSAIISSILASFLPRAAHSHSCWHGEYKPGSSPEPLALKAPLFTWSVHWLLLLSAAALQRCIEQTLWSRCCWAQWHWYSTHFKLFYFPNIIGLVQRIVRFVMRTEPKTSYRTVQNEYTYRYTPNIYTYIYIYICVCM